MSEQKGYPMQINLIPLKNGEVMYGVFEAGREVIRFSSRVDAERYVTKPRGSTTIHAKKIVTSFVYPPIGYRAADWSAVRDGYEPGDPLGHGATEKEAIEDLLLQEEDANPSVRS